MSPESRAPRPQAPESQVPGSQAPGANEYRPIIHLYRVNKKYGGRFALENVTLEISNGEFVFLVGPSGAGKSTLLRLITMEEAPTEGQVVVGRYVSSRMTRRTVPRLRRSLGMVYQDFRLLEDLDVHDNVALPLHVAGRSSAEIKKRVASVLMQVGLYPKRNESPLSLSGGEQQRVAIARAVVSDPRILLADEPTGNLDPAVTREILSLLSRINAAGTAVLMATHDHELVRNLGQRVVVLEEGRVASEVLPTLPGPMESRVRRMPRENVDAGSGPRVTRGASPR
jgi:cell division transport system ATP-binding protein